MKLFMPTDKIQSEAKNLRELSNTATSEQYTSEK